MAGPAPDFDRLEVYRTLQEITRLVYEMEDRFPDDELPVLYARLRACAVDAGAKLAEGFGREGLDGAGAVSAVTASEVRAKLSELRHYVLVSASRFFLDESHVQAFESLYAKALAGLPGGAG